MRLQDNKSNRSVRVTEIPEAIRLTFLHLLCFLYRLYGRRMVATLRRQGGKLKSAALGFRAHSGWTALVALSVSKGAPCVLARQRVHLVDTFTYAFRQPYHSAAKMPPAEGRAFISRVRAE